MNKHATELVELSACIANLLAPTDTINIFSNVILRETSFIVTHRKNHILYISAVENILECLTNMIRIARSSVCQSQDLIPIAENLLNKYKQKYNRFEIGMEVKLKKDVNHTCPEGRENNKTAKIQCLLIETQDDVKVDRDLQGCLYWNIENLEICSFEEKSYD